MDAADAAPSPAGSTKSLRHSASNSSLNSRASPKGRRASLPKHLSQSASETSLSERRRSQVSRYLETDDHKSEFATKLRDVRDRERTVSGESPSPLRNSVGLPRQTSFRGSQGSGGGGSNQTTPDKDNIDLPPTDEVLARRERRASALDMVLASSLTLSLDAEDTDPIEQFNKDSPPQEESDEVAAKPVEQTKKSADKPLPIPKEVLARTAAGRNMSMGGLEIIREIKSPNVTGSPLASGSEPDSPLPDIAHSRASNFPTFVSPFGMAMPSIAAPPSSGAISSGEELSPGMSHLTAFKAADDVVKELLSAPPDRLQSELLAKLSYFTALADENATLRHLIQRQADLSPVISVRRFKPVSSPLAAGAGEEGTSPASPEDVGLEEKDEIIRTLADQLTEQMDSHDKLLYELGLIRSHHATLQALSSDYVDELEVLRHKVSTLQKQLDGHQASEEDAAKRKEEEERVKKDNEERISTLRSALEDSKTAIKRLQDESKERRRTLVESRRTSLASAAAATVDPRRVSTSNASSTAAAAAAASTSDGYTLAPSTRRLSLQQSEARRASLRSELGHRRKISASMALQIAARRAESSLGSPELNDSRRDSMVTAIGTPIGLGFEMGLPSSRRPSATPIALGGSGADGLRPGETNWSSRPRRNSSGAVGVHLEGLSPKLEGSGPVVLSEEDKEMRKRDAARGFRNAETVAPSTAATSSTSSSVAPVPVPVPASAGLTTSFGQPARSPRSPRKADGLQKAQAQSSEEMKRMKAELDEYEAMKVEMASIKVKLAESEETRMATQDAFLALKQFIASDAPDKQSPKLDSRFLALPTAATSKEPTSPSAAVSRKPSRWAMPRLTSGFGLSSVAASNPATTTSPTPSQRSLAPLDSPPPATFSATAFPSTASVLSGWTRRANSSNAVNTPSTASSVFSLSPADSPALEPAQQKTPSAPSTSTFASKFSLASLVGKGVPPTPATTTTTAPPSVVASDASPPSLVSASSAESSPIASPSLSVGVEDVTAGPVLGMGTMDEGKVEVWTPIEIKDNGNEATVMDTPRVGAV